MSEPGVNGWTCPECGHRIEEHRLDGLLMLMKAHLRGHDQEEA